MRRLGGSLTAIFSICPMDQLISDTGMYALTLPQEENISKAKPRLEQLPKPFVKISTLAKYQSPAGYTSAQIIWIICSVFRVAFSVVSYGSYKL